MIGGTSVSLVLLRPDLARSFYAVADHIVSPCYECSRIHVPFLFTLPLSCLLFLHCLCPFSDHSIRLPADVSQIKSLVSVLRHLRSKNAHRDSSLVVLEIFVLRAWSPCSSHLFHACTSGLRSCSDFRVTGVVALFLAYVSCYGVEDRCAL